MIVQKTQRLAAEVRKFLRSDKKLWFEFHRHKTWITKFVIDGREYGGWYDAAGDVRLKQFRAAFPEARSILEMGSLEGGHTFCLAQLPGVEHVTALEGRDYNIRKAEFIRRLKGIGNVFFHLADLEKEGLSKYGSFDVVFSLGLLYHLPEPWIHLREVGKVANGLFLWTHYVADGKANGERNGYKGWIYGEYGFQDPLSGLSPTSYWPTLDSLKRMVADCGFPEIEIVELQPDHKDGPAVTLVARSASTAAL